MIKLGIRHPRKKERKEFWPGTVSHIALRDASGLGQFLGSYVINQVRTTR